MQTEQQILDQALALQNKGNLIEATRLYRHLVDKNPKNHRALYFLGAAEAAAGNVDHGNTLMSRAMEAIPHDPEFAESYATDLYRAGEYDGVIAFCRHPLQSNRQSATLAQLAAMALMARGRHAEAVAELDRLLVAQPRQAIAQFLKGSALVRLKRFDEALAAYARATTLNPALAEAHFDSGTIYLERQHHEQALAAYDKAAAAQPAFTEAWLGRGNALLELRRFDEAIASYERALLLKPGLAAALAGTGNALLRQGRHQDAAKAFDQAVQADSNFADAWLGRGVSYLALSRHVDAQTALDRALALNPGLTHGYVLRGQVRYFSKQYDRALDDWNKALAIDPQLSDVAAALLRARMHLCDWAEFDAACTSLRTSIRDGKLVSPFMTVAVPTTASEQRDCARRWIAHTFPAERQPRWRGERYAHDRIRVAYLSADFHQHATSHLMAGLFEHHDRARFEVTAISVGPNENSDMRRRLVAAFEHFVDGASLADDQIASLVRSSEIDVLVDLKGFTQDARLGVLAMQPAPVQVSYLGFPGTTGADFIDYLIADRILIPDDQRDRYAEKVVWLPDSYQANDDRRAIASTVETRRSNGLPDNGFVYCCFNDSYKITPDVFAVWMRLLHAVEGSVLWLYEANPTATANLRREAAARAIAPERLVFAARRASAEHLARHRCADLFLDTLPYGAHTTASDALWAGLPVLTCLGETFAGRVGASLLTAVGLPELIAPTLAEYEARAIALARNPDQLNGLRAKLAANRATAPLFNTATFTRHLEAAYAMMVERQRAGLAPDHLQVPHSRGS